MRRQLLDEVRLPEAAATIELRTAARSGWLVRLHARTPRGEWRYPNLAQQVKISGYSYDLTTGLLTPAGAAA